MAELVLEGTAAAPGVAAGGVRRLDAPGGAAPAGEPAEELLLAVRALDAAAAELGALGARLRTQGRDDEADMVETGVLMAGDPGLRDHVARLVVDEQAGAAGAIRTATAAAAAVIAGLPDPMLAARADDVLSLGRRAVRLASGAAHGATTGADVVVVATDMGPADVAELGEEVRAIALARGAVTAHAAIVARSLGLPMVVGLGERLLDVAEDATVVVDGDRGAAVLEPTAARAEMARRATAARAAAAERSAAEAELPARTTDGRTLRVLANVASAAEVAAALRAGAEGAGLIRTELSFLDAPAWPTEEEHRRALAPLLTALRGHVATVRVLDFGGDKTPPFLAGRPERGIALLLAAPDALAAQLRAVMDAGGDLRILLPLVRGPEDVAAVAAMLASAGGDPPLLGAMIETPEAAARAGEIAARAGFLSIGTNDLTAATLGVDRFTAGTAEAHDPRVLLNIAACVSAARAAGTFVEVCGEAASDPVTLPLLVGLGVDEVSVGAARVGTVRRWIRSLDHRACAELAQRALAAPDAAAVAALVTPLRLAQAGDAAAEGVEGDARVGALSA